MTKARRTEGPGAPLFYSGVALVAMLFSGGPVLAQVVELSDLEICAGLESAELKLACFDAIIATGRQAASPESTPSVEAAPLPDPVAAPAAVVATTAPASVHSGGTPVAADSAAERSAADLETAMDPVSEITPRPAADDFGREHLATSDSAEPEVLTVAVVEVTRGSNRLLSFHLANGQVWRQTEVRHYPYPKDSDFDVTISTGMMGDYRLRVGGTGRMLRVKRVK